MFQIATWSGWIPNSFLPIMHGLGDRTLAWRGPGRSMSGYPNIL